MNFKELYAKYEKELWQLAENVRQKRLDFSRNGHVAAFGDIEGEIMYLVIRELRPDCIFEISPAAGYSTNYILAALTANGHGCLHSFDINGMIHGSPAESVIRGNLLSGLDGNRLQIHIGDARETTLLVEGSVQFCLLDSCHEEWFARWYVEKLLPRVKGWVMIQDICFHDRLEKTTEARYVWQWLREQKIWFELVGALEEELLSGNMRPNFPERRPTDSNSVLLPMPVRTNGVMPQLADDPETILAKAADLCASGNDAAAMDQVILAEGLIKSRYRRPNRHRLLLKLADIHVRLGNSDISGQIYQRALGEVMCKTGMERSKGLREMWRESKARHPLLRYLTGRRNRKTPVGRFPLAWTVLANVLCDRLSNRNAWKPVHTKQD